MRVTIGRLTIILQKKVQKATKKKIKELESAELLKKKRYGHNQPNRLYVLVPVDVDAGNKVPVREVKSDTCEGYKSTPVTGNKVPTNKIIESNNNNISIPKLPIISDIGQSFITNFKKI